MRIQNIGTEVVEAKASAGSATLSMTGTAAIFVELFLKVSYFHYTMMVSTIRLYRLYG